MQAALIRAHDEEAENDAEPLAPRPIKKDRCIPNQEFRQFQVVEFGGLTTFYRILYVNETGNPVTIGGLRYYLAAATGVELSQWTVLTWAVFIRRKDQALPDFRGFDDTAWPGNTLFTTRYVQTMWLVSMLQLPDKADSTVLIDKLNSVQVSTSRILNPGDSLYFMGGSEFLGDLDVFTGLFSFWVTERRGYTSHQKR